MNTWVEEVFVGTYNFFLEVEWLDHIIDICLTF